MTADEQNEKMRREREEMLRALAAAPLQEVSGVVAASGAAGSWSQGDELWLFQLPLAVWRIGNGPVSLEELKVVRQVPKEEIDILRARAPRGSVVRLDARVLDMPGRGPKALLESSIESDVADGELNSWQEKLKAPLTFEDEQFGSFTLDRSVNCFKAETRFADQEARLSLTAEGKGLLVEAKGALQVARKLWSDEQSWLEKALDLAADNLLNILNEYWLEEDEEPFTRDEFKDNLTIESVSVDPDGDFSLWFDDGELFAGHSIAVYGNVEKGLSRAEMGG